MDLAAAEQAQQFVAGPLQRQTAADDVAMVARHRDRVGIAEKIRRVQHHDVQRVAFDPFAAIHQAPQRAKLAADGDAEGVLDRVDGAHLIGDRADAADAGGDVGNFVVAAAPQQRLEKPRRLENIEPRRHHTAAVDVQIERRFALDPRQIVDPDGLSRHAASLSLRNGSAAALKVRSAR